MASTRDVSGILAAAERAGVKVIAIGDSGQLPSVEAGGWLGSLTRRHGSHHLTQVMRQRDVVERRLLARLHGGSPVAYIREKYKRGELATHKSHEKAEAAVLGRWSEKASELGSGQAVMIARDNGTRERLNRAARAELQERGELGEDVAVAGITLATGDRVIARQNDRRLDIDNGMRGSVTAIDAAQGEVTITTDASGERTLGAAYVQNHLEHAYALTGHGLQGGTVEWATVVGEVGAFSRNWSYTALSRAREPVDVHVIDEELIDGEREEVAPKLAAAGRERLSVRLAQRMRLRDDEDLAIDQLPESSAAARIRERASEPQELELEPTIAEPGEPAGAAYVRGLYEQLEEIDSRLSAMPLRELDAIEKAQQRGELAAGELEEAREVLAAADGKQEVAKAEHNVEQIERELQEARKRELELRDVVPDAVALAEAAAPLRDQAREVGREIGVAREAHLESAVIAPATHIVEALGRPPGASHERRPWERAVREIERYRFDHRIDGPEILGATPRVEDGPRCKQFERAASELATAQGRLGLEPTPAAEIATERGLDVEI